MKVFKDGWTSLAFLAMAIIAQSGFAGGPAISVDTNPPNIVSARRLYEGPNPNVIEVQFDKPPLASTVTSSNLRVIQSGTAGPSQVAALVTNVLTSARTVRLYVSAPSWNVSNCYYILASGVTDAVGNMIAANSVFGVTMSQGAVPCPTPTDAPLPGLRLSIEPVGDREVRITWPAGYYGFILESKAPDGPGTIDTWQPLEMQLNGTRVVVAADSNRIFRLRK